MIEIVLLFHIIIAIVIIALVLLQQGKGASMGAAFGGGASNTLFGSRGPASFLMKLTGILVALFFVTSLTLGHLASKKAKSQNRLTVAPQTTQIKTVATKPVTTKPAAPQQKSQQNMYQPGTNQAPETSSSPVSTIPKPSK